LRTGIGDPDFQLDAGSKLKGKLVFEAANKQPADTTPPVIRTHPEITEVPIHIFSGVFQSANDKTADCTVTDRDKISGGKYGKGIKKNGRFPWVNK